MKNWIRNHKNLFSVAALTLACLCLIGLSTMLLNGQHADAQTTAGWNAKHYNQVPADTLTGISGAEILGYAFKFNGTAWDRDRVPNLVKTVGLTAATAETTIWTPTSGKKFRLMGGVLTASAQTLLTFKDNTAGTTILTVELGANSPFTLTPAMLGNGIVSAAANNVLTVTRGTSAILNGFLVGEEN